MVISLLLSCLDIRPESEQLPQPLITLSDFLSHQHGRCAYVLGNIAGTVINRVQLPAQVPPFIFGLIPEVFRLGLAQVQLRTEFITSLFEYFHQFIKFILCPICHSVLRCFQCMYYFPQYVPSLYN